MNEIERIKEAYERRKNLPSGLYSYFNQGNLFITQQRERKLLQILDKYGMNPLSNKQILDIGCGNGACLRELMKYGADPNKLYGVDLLEENVTRANVLSPHLNIVVGNAERLDFDEASFDIVIQNTVFTSILDIQMKQNIAKEMLRVVKDNGIIIWYDLRYNNPRNPDVKGIKSKEIISLFPNCSFEFQKITLAPPLARKLAPYSWLLCYLLEKIPFLRTHYLVVIRKKII